MVSTPPPSEFELICFDVDGTLVKHPEDMVIWEVLNLKFAGSRDINRERLRMYESGEITYDQWVELDVAGWKQAGATRAEIERVVAEFELITGARETIHELKRRGFKLAVISGTLDVVLDGLFPDHPFDEVFTNRISFDAAGRIDSWKATPFDLHGKPEAMRAVAGKYGVPLERAAYVGDGENDLPLIGIAGYFVAFEPRSEALERGADLVIRGDGLHLLLDVFR